MNKMTLRLPLCFLQLPGSVQKIISTYYLKRILQKKATDHEIIWTSFFYFMPGRVRQLKEEDDVYRLSFHMDAKEYAIAIRKGKSSDIFVFFQVFIAREYQPLIDLLSSHFKSPLNVIDAGANVGFFSLLLSHYFQINALIALEPASENFARLQENLKRLSSSKRLSLFPSALWSHPGKLSVVKENELDWSFRVSELPDGSQECDATSLSTIVRENRMERIDVLKLDVEGTEEILFRDSDFLATLSRVRVLAIEIHDDVADRNNIHHQLKLQNFSFYERGELTLAFNRSFIHA